MNKEQKLGYESETLEKWKRDERRNIFPQCKVFPPTFSPEFFFFYSKEINFPLFFLFPNTYFRHGVFSSLYLLSLDKVKEKIWIVKHFCTVLSVQVLYCTGRFLYSIDHRKLRKCLCDHILEAIAIYRNKIMLSAFFFSSFHLIVSCGLQPCL